MSEKSPVYNQGGACRDCYRCVRICPVKAIKVENDKTDIVPEMCIACGRCIESCPRFFKKQRKDIGQVEQLLKQKQKVFVSLDPAFVAEFAACTTAQLITALKELKFFAVSQTALGMELADTDSLLEDFYKDKKLCISSDCPSVVKYIKLFKKKFAPFISPQASPLLIHSRLLRKWYGDDIGIVSISPCIAKKIEADQFPEIDAAITFSELRQWFMYESIIPEQIEAGEYSFEPYPAQTGAEHLWANSSQQIATFSASGLFNINNMINNFSPETLAKPVRLSVLACSGGCINGPGMSEPPPGITRHLRLLESDETAEAASRKAATTFNADGISMTGELVFPLVIKATHTNEEIRKALSSIGKYSRHDENNCGSCGYNTCRDFAESMLEKHAEKTMCVSNMRILAQRQANGLLKAIPSGVVIVDKDLTIIECNYNFARIMGKEIEEMWEAKPGLSGAKLERITDAAKCFKELLTNLELNHKEYEIRERKKIFHLNVFIIEKGETAAGVIEDITMPQIQKDRTIANAKNIIDKNVSVVQQIAFLLGEHAAETESILHSMIESFANEGDE
jgi:iron only hydrogenase large subunit-like protein